MYALEKTFRFEAGHCLEHHDGKCKDPHGHSYVLGVCLSSDSLVATGPKTNMILDFADIAAIVKPMIEAYFDHKWLNDTLKTDSPTIEFMAKWIYDYLQPKLAHLSAITIWETTSCKVTYSR